ncbi:carotenoid biosynthesis protein [Sphaerisporangium sp. NPDC049003]|uniref:carotenoid biosynthesis protein n=1 Tax=Sphaerisporangium sp. NPDC049003 TaxID=3364517 RepID=UPI00371E3A4C
MEEAIGDRRETGEVRGVPTARVRSNGFTVAGAVFLVAMVAAQVASGLQPRPVQLTSVVVLLLAVSAVAFAAAAHGLPRAVTAFSLVVAVGYAAEWIGIRAGIPFGPYRYTDVLWPQFGGVPVIVALAWGGMGLAAYAVAKMVVTGDARTSGTSQVHASPTIPLATPTWTRRGTPARIVVGALALTSWDLFLDPQMLRLGLWAWDDPGPYRGVPVSNFVGWVIVSLVVMTLLDMVLREAAPKPETTPARSAARRGPEESRGSQERGPTGSSEAPQPAGPNGSSDASVTTTGLVAVYTVMAVMETAGFAVVFEPPDLLVASAGGACMGLFALLAWRRRWLR